MVSKKLDVNASREVFKNILGFSLLLFLLLFQYGFNLKKIAHSKKGIGSLQNVTDMADIYLCKNLWRSGAKSIRVTLCASDAG